MEVAGLVLAAGAGRRYGTPKALVAYAGRLLVERATATLRDAGYPRPVVVLGAAAASVRAHADLGDATLVDNPDWSSGLGSSLRAGLAALAPTGASAALVLLVDMPGVTAEAVRRVTAGADADALVLAGYPLGRRGHPVLLGRRHWAGVAELAVGDVGARPYLRAHAARVRVVDCADVADDTDLDTPAPQHPAGPDADPGTRGQLRHAGPDPDSGTRGQLQHAGPDADPGPPGQLRHAGPDAVGRRRA